MYTVLIYLESKQYNITRGAKSTNKPRYSINATNPLIAFRVFLSGGIFATGSYLREFCSPQVSRFVQAIMTLKGMRKADQQMVLDTLGMDRVPATTRSETVGTSATASQLPESGPMGAARLTATIPNFETNTRWVALAVCRRVFARRLVSPHGEKLPGKQCARGT